jgi:hypothetical protein
VARGDNYASPATVTSDSVMALSLATGRTVWTKQITSGDAYNRSAVATADQMPTAEGPNLGVPRRERYGANCALKKRV